MQTTETVNPVENTRTAVIGPPGAGKTWLAGTWPDPFFIDADRGIRTLTNHEFRTKYPMQIARYIVIDDPTDPKTGIFTKATGFKETVSVINEIADSPTAPKTYVLDSATTFSDLCAHFGLELNDKGAKPRSYTLREAKQYGGMILKKQDFGAEMNLFEQFMDQFIKLPANIVVLFHEREDTDEKGTLIRVSPLITGAKLRGKIGKWFDEVYALEVTGSATTRRRKLTTGSTALRPYLKSRLGLPVEILDPDYNKIISLVHEAQAKIPVAQPRTTP